MSKEKVKNKKLDLKSANKGITLIALVITIIVILILAGVSINTLFGDNGLLTKAQEAANANSQAGAYDKVATEVLASYDNNGTLNASTLQSNIVAHTGGTATLGSDDGFPVTVVVDGYTFTIDKDGNITKKGEIAGGGDEQGDEPPKETIISEGEDCLGYYADLDGDGNADGIIYADLAIGHEEEAKWSNDNGTYKYSKKTDELNQYIKESEYTSDKFGGYKAPMVKLAESSSKGKDRFYVMDLEDYDENTHTWYASAYDSGGLPTEKAVGSSVSDLENDSGKTNTDYWIAKNDDAKYQTQYGELGDNDIWKILKGNLHKKDKDWFVPSRAEWSAFADMCVTKVKVNFGSSGDYNTKFGLSGRYWSSSQNGSIIAWIAGFSDCYVFSYDIYDTENVRLSATF